MKLTGNLKKKVLWEKRIHTSNSKLSVSFDLSEEIKCNPFYYYDRNSMRFNGRLWNLFIFTHRICRLFVSKEVLTNGYLKKIILIVQQIFWEKPHFNYKSFFNVKDQQPWLVTIK